ncbi:Protein LTV1 [Fusarium oxysporum f. sp. albedinis]|nr:Protein LTV1 [Fusarium oxysporum f. sp. albedinis]
MRTSVTQTTILVRTVPHLFYCSIASMQRNRFNDSRCTCIASHWLNATAIHNRNTTIFSSLHLQHHSLYVRTDSYSVLPLPVDLYNLKRTLAQTHTQYSSTKVTTPVN